MTVDETIELLQLISYRGWGGLPLLAEPYDHEVDRVSLANDGLRVTHVLIRSLPKLAYNQAGLDRVDLSTDEE